MLLHLHLALPLHADGVQLPLSPAELSDPRRWGPSDTSDDDGASAVEHPSLSVRLVCVVVRGMGVGVGVVVHSVVAASAGAGGDIFVGELLEEGWVGGGVVVVLDAGGVRGEEAVCLSLVGAFVDVDD